MPSGTDDIVYSAEPKFIKTMRDLKRKIRLNIHLQKYINEYVDVRLCVLILWAALHWHVYDLYRV